DLLYGLAVTVKQAGGESLPAVGDDVAGAEQVQDILDQGRGQAAVGDHARAPLPRSLDGPPGRDDAQVGPVPLGTQDLHALDHVRVVHDRLDSQLLVES